MKIILTILSLILCTSIFSQKEIELFDISSYDAVAEHDDLRFLDESLKDVLVVGIGESTHGTKEFNQMNLKLFKYLVDVHDYNTLYLEDEFSICLSLDKYIKCDSECDSTSVKTLRNWPWCTNEMNQLLEWMKAYNKENRSNMLSIVGIDMQDSKSITASLNTILKDSKVDTISLPKAVKGSTEKTFNNYLKSFSNEKMIASFQNKINEIDKSQVDIYNKLLSDLSWNKLMLEKRRKYHLRDLGMGKNLVAHLEKNQEAKGMLIAHNGHLAKYSKGKKDEMKNYLLLGGFLDQELGKKFFYIMQDFDEGCFNAYHLIDNGNTKDINSYDLSPVCIEPGIENSIGAVLRNNKATMSYITEEDLFKLAEVKTLRKHSIGAVFRPEKKNPNQSSQFYFIEEEDNHFDACILHKKSSPTQLLKTE